MGLDIVEFALAVEEAFDHRIPDHIASVLYTPRNLIDYLHSQLPQSSEAGCLSQRAFYTIRRSLSQHLRLTQSWLRPDTALLSVLPPQHAQEVWAAVGRGLGIPKWPRARGGSWLAQVFRRSRPRTVGDAASHVATFCPTLLKRPGEGWSWYEVAYVVDRLMWWELGISKYLLDDRFSQDLGVE